MFRTPGVPEFKIEAITFSEGGSPSVSVMKPLK